MLQSGTRIETRLTHVPAINHHPHPFDGQTGLGDVSGQHYLALSCGGQGPFLFSKGQIGVEGTEQDFAHGRMSCQQLPAALNITDAGEKHQQIPFRRRPCPDHRCGGNFGDAAHRGLVQVADLHRKAAPAAAQKWRVTKQPRDRCTIKGGRHDQQLEVVTQP